MIGESQLFCCCKQHGITRPHIIGNGGNLRLIPKREEAGCLVEEKASPSLALLRKGACWELVAVNVVGLFADFGKARTSAEKGRKPT
jgi:hypothetical protein